MPRLSRAARLRARVNGRPGHWASGRHASRLRVEGATRASGIEIRAPPTAPAPRPKRVPWNRRSCWLWRRRCCRI